MIATGRNPATLASLSALGADATVSLTQAQWAELDSTKRTVFTTGLGTG